MKSSQLKLGAIYVGAKGDMRFLSDRSFSRALLLHQHDADCVIYQKVDNGIIEEDKHMVTARAFARWAVKRADL